jgi:Transglycosylase SLT domain
MVELHSAIIEIARETRIDPPLALALCAQESSFNQWAWNPEPRYRYLWNIIQSNPFRQLSAAENKSEIPPNDFPAPPGCPRDAEWWGQQASWGIAQIMGAVARERGFRGRFLPQLCDTTVGLPLALEHLRIYIVQFQDIYKGLEAYNGGPGAVGRNASYADAVMERVKKWEGMIR